ncbi:glutamine amidotransferase [uncultured Oxalicibacterium sp.]|uniref:glutamine amidotransferase n=1 Tax=uncultured Oxalicibacterium sp. TaxID=1168540 RepID=UPI0025DAF6CD|nr:glutamine amidotransferase [uncultured Oxalicibacterium sp.]
MKTVLALRHVHFEDLGIFEPVLQAHGYAIQYVDATIAPLTGLDVLSPDLMVVLGGPIGAFDDDIYPFVRDEVALVEQRIHSGKPLLGICLGAQFMARALGADVRSMGVKEIGFSPLSLTEAGRCSPLALLGEVPVLHWHGDRFMMPAKSAHLASSAACDNQAFSVGPNVLGLQFHLEADVARIEQWLVGHASELAQAGIRPGSLREHAVQYGPALQKAAVAILEAWLRQTEPASV